MSETGPAFPAGRRIAWNPATEMHEEVEDTGLTRREYAAIHLKVPSSGTDWLDEMIREANRNELAARAMQGQCVFEGMDGMDAKHVAGCACEVADALVAMLAERGRER